MARIETVPRLAPFRPGTMAKKTRRKFINFPAKVLERSKRFWLKVPEMFYKGVIELIAGWRFLAPGEAWIRGIVMISA